MPSSHCICCVWLIKLRWIMIRFTQKVISAIIVLRREREKGGGGGKPKWKYRSRKEVLFPPFLISAFSSFSDLFSLSSILHNVLCILSKFVVWHHSWKLEKCFWRKKFHIFVLHRFFSFTVLSIYWYFHLILRIIISSCANRSQIIIHFN